MRSLAVAPRKVYTREMLSLHELATLKRINFAESGYMHMSHLSEVEVRAVGALARKGLVSRRHGYVAMERAGRYIVEPEATEELYGPQGY